MARILCAWELGANLGHLSRLLALANQLRVKRHEVVFAVRDVNAAAPFLRRHRFEFVPLPDMSQRRRPTGLPIRSYSEILAAAGLCDAEGLLAAVSGWRSLLTLLRPRAILLDHAPTGLLAVRATGIPGFVVGSGFSVPPRRHPFPAFRPGSSISIAELEAADQRVLDVVNAVCRELGLLPLVRLGELLDVEASFLCTVPELDHYREREPGVRYWGPVAALSDGLEYPVWPSAPGPRIFAYLQPSLKNLDSVLTGLARSGASVVVYAAGLAEEAISRVGNANMHFARSPVSIFAVCKSAHLGVTHAGAGTTTDLLLGGVPVLMFPQHLEQYLFARRVAELGAGMFVERTGHACDFSALALRTAADENLHRAARGFAHAHREFNSATAAQAVVERIEAYL